MWSFTALNPQAEPLLLVSALKPLWPHYHADLYFQIQFSNYPAVVGAGAGGGAVKSLSCAALLGSVCFLVSET